MKISFPLIALFIFFLSACGEKKPLRSKEAEVIWNLQNDQKQPDYVRKGAGVLLDVLEEKENIKLRDYFNADRKVSSVRSDAIARTWIALLHSTEKKIPEVLPTAEEMNQEKQKSNKSKSRVIHYSTYTRLGLLNSCVSALALLDLPESNVELDAFFQRFEKRYGGSSGGQKMFKLYEMERSQAKEKVRLKGAPWQEGPNPSAP